MTKIILTIDEDLSPSDQHAMGLLLADSFRAFIASRSGDYVARRYPASDGYNDAFRAVKQQLTDQRLRLAHLLINSSFRHEMRKGIDERIEGT